MWMIPWKEREEKEKSVRKSETDMTMRSIVWCERPTVCERTNLPLSQQSSIDISIQLWRSNHWKEDQLRQHVDDQRLRKKTSVPLLQVPELVLRVYGRDFFWHLLIPPLRYRNLSSRCSLTYKYYGSKGKSLPAGEYLKWKTTTPKEKN